MGLSGRQVTGQLMGVGHGLSLGEALAGEPAAQNQHENLVIYSVQMYALRSEGLSGAECILLAFEKSKQQLPPSLIKKITLIVLSPEGLLR